MPIIRIDMQIVVGANGEIGPTPIITVPNQPHAVRIVWTIVGGKFDPAGGISINPSTPVGVISTPEGDALEWSAIDTNNSLNSGVPINYTIVYTRDTDITGLTKIRRDDPVIDNQPPTG